ncbi:MAG: FHA domain-containing protein [Magnetococcales bacterium]|nr:FHA domain-containing protein [Magnetococcales bacterium]MBF0150687.1 FHA domain-containing protein [Magnetococcales bacterium]MBF0173184.1 FHA domain-containing protein [Magnetococcales bacterium]MBF0347582.1 FHA domain-containing protein [Magnetococcales bacterium]MBF0631691.1 FHA domain-containing protein [Magnetococcales bacterium]
MPRDVPAIHRFLKNSGRLDFAALESFALSHDEQEFTRLLQVPVLMGNEVLIGTLTTRVGDATVFVPEEPDIKKRQILLRPPLMHLIFPFIKQSDSERQDYFTIGRGEYNDFVLPDYTISMVQAGIRRTGANRYLLHHRSATNPTLFNGRRSDQAEVFLHDEDRLTFGRYEFLFLSPSALYCRFRGVELKLRIQNFLDSLGKADHDALKNYAIRHGQEMFVQLIMNPSFVGSGLFRGYSLERSSEDSNSTLAFLPDLTLGAQSKQLKMLERAIYPLVVSETEETSHPVLRIGRAETNDIIMPEGSISNRHATIDLLGPGQYRLTDLGSTNGTFINNKPIPKQGQDLLDGQRIKMGRFEFLFLFPGSLYLHITPENVRR